MLREEQRAEGMRTCDDIGLADGSVVLVSCMQILPDQWTFFIWGFRNRCLAVPTDR